MSTSGCRYLISKTGLIFLLQLVTFFSTSQTIVNAYAKVTSITSGSVLALSNVNITNHTFTVGGLVIVMQMQDDVIGTNTTNVSTFGSLSSIANAGIYQVRTIAAVTPTSGTPTSVTLTSALSGTYNTGTNSSVQMISFRDLGANYTTTANLAAVAWDGNVGGVLAIATTGTLTLNHRLLAEAVGFRGGSYSNNNGGAICTSPSNTIYIANNANLGYKGESIYRNTTNTFNNARGRMLNGGGGGNDHNAGGGGGGNYTSGGQGGNGYNNCTTFPGGGLGGLSLSSNISASRVFMGGGGGGGQQNNSQNSSGGNGGGIILVKAGTIATSTTCGSTIRMSANGANAINGGNDGMGGGGAGGSIVIDASAFSINAACPLTLRANGGDGGDCTDGAAHAGGGGGGQGVVIFSSAQPTTNVTTQTSNGAAGQDNSGGTVSAGAGSGTNGSGIIASSSGPLPIELIEFKATESYDRVLTQWSTATEQNNAMFVVERSTDGIGYSYVASVPGAGNSQNINNYSAYDNNPVGGISYYRLKQIDFDGSYEYSPVVAVDRGEELEVSLTPNPINEGDQIKFTLSEAAQHPVTVEITNLAAAVTSTGTVGSDDQINFTVNNFYPTQGVYIVRVQCGGAVAILRLLVQ
ncbi:MAG: T9SS type A sorting domain-containing protein [Bacteroidia bacterium]|nr:T9SS type A sorting domain-containing protein [Bacteroidia bacterium]